MTGSFSVHYLYDLKYSGHCFDRCWLPADFQSVCYCTMKIQGQITLLPLRPESWYAYQRGRSDCFCMHLFAISTFGCSSCNRGIKAQLCIALSGDRTGGSLRNLLICLPMSCWIVVAALFMYHDGALPWQLTNAKLSSFLHFLLKGFNHMLKDSITAARALRLAGSAQRCVISAIVQKF